MEFHQENTVIIYVYNFDKNETVIYYRLLFKYISPFVILNKKKELSGHKVYFDAFIVHA